MLGKQLDPGRREYEIRLLLGYEFIVDINGDFVLTVIDYCVMMIISISIFFSTFIVIFINNFRFLADVVGWSPFSAQTPLIYYSGLPNAPTAITMLI